MVTTPCQGGVATEATGRSGGASFGRCLRDGRLLPSRGARTRRGLAATALSLHGPSCRQVAHVIEGSHLRLGLLLEVQLLTFNLDISSTRFVLDVGLGPTLGGDLRDVHLLILNLNITTSRDMLNIVLGTTLGLNMAVAHFFRDYLDFPSRWSLRTRNGTGCFSDCVRFRLSSRSRCLCFFLYFGPASSRLVLDVFRGANLGADILQIRGRSVGGQAAQPRGRGAGLG